MSRHIVESTARQVVSARPAGRIPMPAVLRESNPLLAAGHPPCERAEPPANADTANPGVVGHAGGGARYAIKVVLRHRGALRELLAGSELGYAGEDPR